MQKAVKLSSDVTAAIEGKTYTNEQATQAIADMAKLTKMLAVPATIETASDANPIEITNVITKRCFFAVFHLNYKHENCKMIFVG